MPADLTVFEYRVWRLQDELQNDTETLQMKSQVAMADYHFRVNAKDFGVDPSTITTQIHWTGDAECRFMIEAPAAEEVISLAWKTAAVLIGLRTERVP